MSRIDELIAKLCPNGVEYKALGEVAGFSSTKISASELDATTFVGVDNLLPNKSGRTESVYPPTSGRLTSYEPGDVLLGNIRPYLKKIWLADRVGGSSGDVLAIRISSSCRKLLSPDYLYYILSTDAFFAYAMQHAKGAKMPRGDKRAILAYRIPIPPLEIQEETVRVLDSFSALEAELETQLQAELEARRRQYEHYRNQLLMCKEHVEYKALGEVAELVRGNGLPKSVFTEAGVGAIHYGQIYTHYKTWATEIISFVTPETAAPLTKVDPGDLIVTNTSENLEDVGKAVAWLGDSQIVTGGHATVVKHHQNSKYLSYWFQTQEFATQKRKLATGTKVIDVSAKQLSRVMIPIPPLEEQERIAAILDKFDALVNDLSVGLPAELNARRKQYEYYRDKLLTFKELAA